MQVEGFITIYLHLWVKNRNSIIECMSIVSTVGKFSRRQTIENEKMTSTNFYKNVIISQEIETKYFAVD